MAALAAFCLAVLPPKGPASAGPVENEILFLMDMSGSMAASSGHPDGIYAYWLQEIAFVQNFIDQTHRADGGNAYGIIHFSGGTSSQTVEQAAQNGRMNLVYGLTDPDTDFHTGNSVPGAQDKASLDAFVGGMGPADFEGGLSWNAAALDLALKTFALSPNTGTNRYIFFLTDGEPATSGFELTDPGTGYVSPELQQAQAEDITIAAVGFDITSDLTFFESVPSSPDLFFDGAGSNDFSDFLPDSSVTASIPAPPVWAFLLGGLAITRRWRVN